MQPVYDNEVITLRGAEERDLETVLTLIRRKAEFDGCPEAVQATPDRLRRALFDNPIQASVLLAEHGSLTVGFASYYSTFSSFLGLPGLWLDDLFVLPEYRSRTVGTALFRRLAEIAQETGCGRIEWTVAVANDPAIAFYRKHEAVLQENTRVCRLTADGIARVARAEPW